MGERHEFLIITKSDIVIIRAYAIFVNVSVWKHRTIQFSAINRQEAKRSGIGIPSYRGGILLDTHGVSK